MAEKRVFTSPAASTTTIRETSATRQQQKVRLPLFEKDNYMWMGIGALVIIIGMFIMSGGKNESANKFDYNVVYSTTRITIAPILILAGFVIEIYAIFKRPKAKQ